ncbi:MAG: Ig-like domain-containing protein [Acidobacteriota bacterium]
MFLALLLVLPAAADIYTYDDLNRLTSVTYDDGSKITYTYDAAGNILSITNTGVTKPVTGIALNVQELNLTVGGDTYALIPSITPPDATNKVVYWTSSNSVVASVYNGVVTPVGAGTATITATTANGSFTDNCAVTVTASTSPYDSYTKVMLHMDGQDNGTEFTDSTGKLVTANGNVCTKTLNKKFGTSSAFFDGNGDYLTVPDSGDLNFGNGDFTVDTWVYFKSLPPADGYYAPIYNQAIDSTHLLCLYLYNLNGVCSWRINLNGSEVLIAADSVSTNTWYHVAFVRSGNTWKVYKNGSQVGSTVSNSSTVPDFDAPLKIGSYGTTHYFDGYIDEFRVSKGIARWIDDFTVPAIPYGPAVAVTGVSLDKHALSLQVAGSSTTLFASVTPTDAANQTVQWSTTNAAVAQVEANGVITPLGLGTATITATTIDGGFSDSCAVTVTQPSVQYDFTGDVQTYVVPAGVTQIKADLWGASGKSMDGFSPGKGGYTSGIINVTPGQTLYIYVGGTGDRTTYDSLMSWNGNLIGLGGGATDIRTVEANTQVYDPLIGEMQWDYHWNNVGSQQKPWNEPASLSSRILVAGGGGCSGKYSSYDHYDPAGTGGDGGGLTADSATNGHSYGGGGGTQTSGGTGGWGSAHAGSAGKFGVGGYQGGSGGGGGGGAGGGGWYGGGGGGGTMGFNNDPSGGGGGGSSYAAPGITEVTLDKGVNIGNGKAIITPMTYETISCTGVVLNNHIMTLQAGGATATLIATVAPAEATNKAVYWVSSNAAVAQVDAKGVVTSVGVGTATITATTVDGGFSDSCTLTVTAPPYDSYTKLLMHMDGSDNGTVFTDETGKTVTKYGDVVTKSGVKKLGTASGYFDGNGDYLTVDGDVTATGNTSSPFSIDCWINLTQINKANTIFVQNHGYRNGDFIFLIGSAENKLRLYRWTGSGSNIKYAEHSVPISPSQWIHVAGEWTSTGQILLSVNGDVETYTPMDLSATPGDGSTRIGSRPDGTESMSGYVDELRVSDGIVRWTEDFTPTTENIAVTGISLDKHALSLAAGGGSATLIPTIIPEDATNKSVYWTSSNSAIASVNNGLVTPLAEGSVAITVYSVDGSYFDTCNVMVNPAGAIPVTGIYLNILSYSLPVNGQPETLYAYVIPANATNKNVIWSSSNPGVATVNNDGVVTPVSVGTAIITATTEQGGFTCSCAIEVKPIAVQGVSLDVHAMNLKAGGQSSTLTATVAPGNAANKNVIWTTSNAAVATVNNGIVIPVGAGTAVIQVTTQDGGKYDRCTVTVAANTPVSGVTLDKHTINLEIGGSAGALTATIQPTNASNKNVIWSSSDTSVATVNNGTVTAVGAGTATITVTTEDWGKTDTCQVTVSAATRVTGVALDKHSMTLKLGGGSGTLIATVAPSNATNKNVTWSNSNPGVVTVNNGTITPVGTGSAIVTVTTADGSYTDTCVVAIGIPVTGIYLNTSYTSLPVDGASETLYAYVMPANATNKNVIWSSSDPSIATVDNNGLITPVSVGTTTVTATTQDGSFSESCAVVIRPIAVQGVSLDVHTMNLKAGGQSGALTATIAPSNAANKNVTWTTSNASIATVNNGIVIPLGAGSAVIQVTTQDGGKYDRCTITVAANTPVTGVTLDKHTMNLEVGGPAGTLSAAIQPTNASNKNVIWSSDTSVATVNNGTVTAVGPGTATVTVTTEDGSKTDTCLVTVTAATHVTGVTLDKHSMTLKMGVSGTLTATVTPSNAFNRNVIWSTSNPSIVTVNNGTVTPVGTGTANITVTTADGSYYDTCSVTVAVPVTYVYLSEMYIPLKVGDSPVTLIAYIYPTNATNKNVTWTTSNPNVATVNNGVVTPVGPGNAIITAKTEDGGYTETCGVVVSN